MNQLEDYNWLLSFGNLAKLTFYINSELYRTYYRAEPYTINHMTRVK